MATGYERAGKFLKELLANETEAHVTGQLAPKFHPAAPGVPGLAKISAETLARRWQLLPNKSAAYRTLLDSHTVSQAGHYQNNIENFIGTVKVPVGLAGPLRVNGLYAQGDYYVPMATTEAALVASYSRGAKLISRAGGCTAALLSELVSRAPAFAFHNLRDCGQFINWVVSELDQFKQLAASTTRHGQLVDMQLTVEGNHVYLNFEYTTGDAAGQNMVTIATQAIFDYIQSHTPIEPCFAVLEANHSGDKKASARSFGTVRGKKVTAEVVIPVRLVESNLRTTPVRLAEYWRMAAIGGVMSGTLGVHGHYANALAAIYIACGQDAACVAESAVGVTRFELTGTGDLYAAVTLPNLMVGSVGGGTGLPSQRTCLEIMGLSGPGRARALAEVCAAICLAGELSIAGALCAGSFANAHHKLARAKTSTDRSNGTEKIT